MPIIQVSTEYWGIHRDSDAGTLFSLAESSGIPIDIIAGGGEYLSQGKHVVYVPEGKSLVRLRG